MSFEAIIEGTAAAVEGQPEAAKVVFTVQGRLVGPTEFDTTVRQHTVKVDEPPTLGGEDLAPNPVEYALAAFASCQAITYRFWAAKLGIALDRVEVAAEGDLDVRGIFGLDEDVRAGFTEVRLAVTPSGPESPERYRELADAVDAHCPVFDLFANATPVVRRVAVSA
ncbi:MAG: OsmC family protein [Thermoleophilia bacterium]